MPAIVEVNDRMCEAIARVLEQYSIPADIEDTSIEGMNAARISIYGKKYWEQSPSLISPGAKRELLSRLLTENHRGAAEFTTEPWTRSGEEQMDTGPK